MKIYIIRHGTTCWNEKQIIQGFSNNRLSLNGKLLVEESSKKHKNTKFDVIFSSPLMRAMQTANIMNKCHNVKIIKDVRLIEVDQGIFTGRKKSSLTDEERKLRKQKAASCGMEKFESVYVRSKEFLDYIRTLKYKNILIVTHNVNASLMECIIKNEKVNFEDKKQTTNFHNAEVRYYKI